MKQIMSATTARGGAVQFGRQADFLHKANVLLEQAREASRAGQFDVALEAAYQAGLRTAGARIAAAKLSARKRKSMNAWEQLRLLDDAGAGWAIEFSRYSRLRSRVGSGLERDPSPEVVAGLIALATDFLHVVELEAGGFPAAA